MYSENLLRLLDKDPISGFNERQGYRKYTLFYRVGRGRMIKSFKISVFRYLLTSNVYYTLFLFL